MKRVLSLTTIVALMIVGMVACNRDAGYAPKPRAYLRFDFPVKDYTLYDTTALPFSFERASTSMLAWKKHTKRDIWIDILYPDYRGVVFLSYKPLSDINDLRGQIDTSYELLKMHFDYTSGIDEKQYTDAGHRVYATTYKLKGSSVASTYQFWATDSVRHFLRGSLYLDCLPANDSLSPVLEYLQTDIIHLLETLRWKE